jgi:GNAT superfamily N-acetyltransferase
MATQRWDGAQGVEVRPANRASWDDLMAVFSGYDCRNCYCARYKVPGRERWNTGPEPKLALLREQTACDDPDSPGSSGLVAYVHGEPAGWCAVEPRTGYPAMRTVRTPWAGRHEDKDDDAVWAVTCFVVRPAHRRQHLTYVLAKAAVAHARAHGASALEGYAMVTEPGVEITWGELHVGPVGAYRAAGLTEVHRPSKRRVIMRIDF